MEFEGENEIRLWELELKVKEFVSQPGFQPELPSAVPAALMSPMSPPCLLSSVVRGEPCFTFSASKNIALVLLFSESEVNTYFSIFESIAT